MRWLLMLLVLVFAQACAAPKAQSAEGCSHPWVFFDLGNTLVDTKTYDYNKIFYMPGALKYVKDLRAKGYHLGLIVNYPDEDFEEGRHRRSRAGKDQNRGNEEMDRPEMVDSARKGIRK